MADENVGWSYLTVFEIHGFELRDRNSCVISVWLEWLCWGPGTEAKRDLSGAWETHYGDLHLQEAAADCSVIITES